MLSSLPTGALEVASRRPITSSEFAFIKILDGRVSSSQSSKSSSFEVSFLASLSNLFKRSYDVATDVFFGLRDRIVELPDNATDANEYDLDALILLLRCFGKISQTIPVESKEAWVVEGDLIGMLIGWFASPFRLLFGHPLTIVSFLSSSSTRSQHRSATPKTRRKQTPDLFSRIQPAIPAQVGHS